MARDQDALAGYVRAYNELDRQTREVNTLIWRARRAGADLPVRDWRPLAEDGGRSLRGRHAKGLRAALASWLPAWKRANDLWLMLPPDAQEALRFPEQCWVVAVLHTYLPEGAPALEGDGEAGPGPGLDARVNLSKIRTLREAAGLRQADLAGALGYKSPSGYRRLETGQCRLTAERLVGIAEILKVPVSSLVTPAAAGVCHG